MAIENLTKKRLNIEDLRMPEESSASSAETELRKLKDSELYDKKQGLWNYSAHEDEEVGKLRVPYNQLLEIYITSFFNKGKAERELRKLKKSDFFNELTGDWNHSIMDEEPFRVDTACMSHFQLFGVLVEARFDKDKARERYRELKGGLLYNENEGMWNAYTFYVGAEKKVDTSQYSNSQLMGVIAEGILEGKEKAKEQYERLKRSRLYDREKDQWKLGIREGEVYDTRYSASELVAVMAENFFDNGKAKEKLRKLKDSPLYDKEKKRWNYSMGENQKVNSTAHYTDVDLLGLLVEEDVYAEENFFPERVAFPNIRKF